MLSWVTCSELLVRDGRIEGFPHSPPARAPKLQLAVDQSLTGRFWNPQIKIPHIQIKEATVRYCSVMSDSLQLHGLQHSSLPSPSLSPSVCSNSCPLSQWYNPGNNWIKALLSKTLPTRANCFSHHQFLHQRGDRRSKNNHSPTVLKQKPHYRNLIRKVMSQMKRQDKILEKQLSEGEIGYLPEKDFRIMIVKMIQDLGKTMEKMKEMVIEELKNKQINRRMQ